jgi:hypothetical protein
MTYVLLFCQLVLALTMLSAGVGKFLQSDQFSNAMRSSHIPEPLGKGMNRLLPTVEVGLATLLIVSTRVSLPVVLAATAALLAIFTGWMVWVYLQGIRVDCGCFGARRSDIGPGSITRNLLLLVVSVGGLVASEHSLSLLPAPSLWTVITTTCLGMSAAGLLAFRQVSPGLILSVSGLRKAQTSARLKRELNRREVE